MSQKNTDLYASAIDTFNRRDIDAFLALMDSDMEFTPYERAIEGLGPYHGHDGVRTWWQNSFEAFPDLNVELFEVQGLGDCTLARGRLRGTGAGSGAPFDRLLCVVAEWRDGKVAWWYAFANEAEALEAVKQRE